MLEVVLLFLILYGMVYERGGMWDRWNGGEENKEMERREKYEIINQRLINLLFMRRNMTSRCVKNSILFINYTYTYVVTR